MMRATKTSTSREVRSLILILVLSIGLISPTITSAEVKLSFQSSVDEVILDMCQAQTREAFILTSLRILGSVRKAEKQLAFEEVALNTVGIDKICEIGRTLVGVTKTGQFYELHDSLWVKAGGLQAENSNETEENIVILDIKSGGNVLYLLVFSSTIGEQQLLSVDRIGKSIEVLPIKNPDNFSLLNDNTLLIYNAENQDFTFTTYDLVSKTISDYVIPGEIPFLSSIVLDSENNTLYAASSSQVLKSMNQSEFSELSPTKYVGHLLVLGKDSLLAWSGNSVFVLSSDGDAMPDVLSIMGMSSRFDNAFTATTGVKLIPFVHPSMSVMEHLSLAITTKDPTVDVYSFLTREGLSRIRDKKVYTDLSQSSILMGISNELYPAIRTALYDDGKLMCWPVNVQPLLRMVNEDALSQYGIESPNTIDELLDVVPLIIQSGMIEDNNMRLFDTLNFTRKDMLTFLMRQFIFHQQQKGQEINFDDELFRRLAHRIVSEVPLESPFPEVKGDEMPLFIMSAISPIIQEGLLPQLKLDSNTDAGIETWVQIAIINPFSKNKTQALNYLEFFAQQKDEESYSAYESMLSPFKSPYVTQEIARLTSLIEVEKATEANADEKHLYDNSILQLESQIEHLRNNEYLVTVSAIANFHSLSRQFVISENSLMQYDDSLEALVSQLVAGLYTIDEFIAASNQHVRLIYNENQQ